MISFRSQAWRCLRHASAASRSRRRKHHCGGSKLIALGALPARSGEVPQDKRVVAYCKTRLRAWEAQRILAGQGIHNVEILEGGFVASPFETEQGA